MEVDRPAAVARRPCATAHSLEHLLDQLEAIHHALARVIGGIAIGAEARIDAGTRRILQRAAFRGLGNAVE